MKAIVESTSFKDEDDSSLESDYMSTYGGTREDEDNVTAKPIAEREDRAVNRSKLCVYFVLFVTAVGAGISCTVFLNRQNYNTFEVEFAGYATELARITEVSAESKFSIARSLSITMTSYAVDKDIYFPFVTLPDFEIRTEEARELSDAEVIAFLPLVHRGQASQWSDYSVDNQRWIRDGLDRQGLQIVEPGRIPRRIYDPTPDEDEPLRISDDLDVEPEELEEFVEQLVDSHAPIWQMGRAPVNASVINLDALDDGAFKSLALDVLVERKGLISQIVNLEFLYEFTFSANRNFNRQYQVGDNRRGLGPLSRPELATNAHSYILEPIFETFERKAEIVGFLMIVVPWDAYFQNVYPDTVRGVEVVVSDSCGSSYTYRIDGAEGRVKGWGDLHDRTYDNLRERTILRTGTLGVRIADTELGFNSTHCKYVMDIYPTGELEDVFTETNEPYLYGFAVFIIFLFSMSIFAVYDYMVQRRQEKVVKTATKTQAIVSSLFPKSFQDRILEDVEQQVEEEERKRQESQQNGRRGVFARSGRDQLTSFLQGGDEASETTNVIHVMKTKPIADLFPFATIVFADIVGFTPWSSTREPSQVFMLLETIYQHFDMIAKRRRVFKVETVGDCYVAVAGLPEPRKDHAMVMARFARDAMMKFRSVVKYLVVTLGPDTEELAIRIGMHSGPVTAGVLRGERARFQLFGDTVNMTARMESTSLPNKIQVSQETADLLEAAGKANWLQARSEKTIVKGKGELQTYWLDVARGGGGMSVASAASSEGSLEQDELDEFYTGEANKNIGSKTFDHKYRRLIEWNVEILSQVLVKIVANREACGVKPLSPDQMQELEEKISCSHVVLGEVREIISLPLYDPRTAQADQNKKLPQLVVRQLRCYVQSLAAMYRDNPFHNFEHASHVTMSVSKLLSRIVAPDRLHMQSNSSEEDLHDHTYGITSDPLTQFAVLLSALIHDTDHPGVPNSQLVKEQTSLAKVYSNKSVAEQNSVDLAWALLMEDDYLELRNAIYAREEDFIRFRQLVVNTVMATDIMDKELKVLRNGRWDKAFSERAVDENPRDTVDRKATIVIEHLIQASDVAHTMQHWHIYRKWNQRLFAELYEAYRNGRGEKDPSDNWYKGEIGFLEFYVIPLAKKLKNCGVFGVSSDEYLQYAVQNKKEWESKGQGVIEEMVESVKARTQAFSQLSEELAPELDPDPERPLGDVPDELASPEMSVVIEFPDDGDL